MLTHSDHLIRLWMVRKGYRSVSLPEGLYEELDRFVIKAKGKYVSVAEVLRVAVREFLERKEK